MDNVNKKSLSSRRGYLLTRASNRDRSAAGAVTLRGTHRRIIRSHNGVDAPAHADQSAIVDLITAVDVAKLRGTRPYGKIAASPNV